MRSLLALLLLAATAGAAPRNIVLFVTDDMGQDAGCYGNKVIKTPHLDRLAADGTLFPHAFCTTASCSASRSVLLRGLHNPRNRHYGHEHAEHHFSADARLRGLPVLLKEAGYRTARAGKYHVAPEEVFKFDVVLKGNPRSPVEMADNCKGFIAAKDERPFFLYFCTADPHRGGGKVEDLPGKPDRFGNRPQGYPGVEEVTYDPRDVIVPPFLPDTPVCRQELAQYYQSVSRADQGVGALVKLLQESGKWDDTLFVFLSDHGIAFPGAKTTVYEPGLRSPCVVRHPGLKKRGLTCEAMVSWVDVTPTLLDFAGARPRANAFHGRSFLGALGREKPEGWDGVYASHTFHEVTMYYPMRVVRERRYKLIWNIAAPLPYPFASDLWAASTWQDVYRRGPDALYGKRTVKAYIKRPAFELYDLESDPHEVNNLADDPKHADRLEAMKAKLKQFQKKTADPWVSKWEYE
jgi:N-sulfoglucosamine sulfohydrolase